MFYPPVEQVDELLNDFDVVPVFYEIVSDTCTPIHIFETFQQSEEICFILESINDVKQWGRYSFIGIHPKAELKIEHATAYFTKDGKTQTTLLTDLNRYLKKLMGQYRSPMFPNQPRLTGGLIGYFGYDTMRYLEPKLKQTPRDELNIPDCHLFLYDEIIAFDHLTNKVIVIQNIYRGQNVEWQYQQVKARAKKLAQQIFTNTVTIVRKSQKPKMKITSSFTKESYIKLVEKAKQLIAAGEIFQIVPSRRFTVTYPPESFEVYRNFRIANPSSHLYYLKGKDYQIAGVSSGMFINVTKRVVTSKPITVTAPRGFMRQQDKVLEQILLNDLREQKKHTMLVDLGRNDIGKVSKLKTVDVIDFMQVKYDSKIMQLASNIKGILKEDCTAVDALLAALPAGITSGVPKIRAMEIIDQLEPVKRCLYGGAIGYLGFHGNTDTCIATRTVLFRNDKAYIQAGSDIFVDSDPENEYETIETEVKTILEALKNAE